MYCQPLFCSHHLWLLVSYHAASHCYLLVDMLQVTRLWDITVSENDYPGYELPNIGAMSRGTKVHISCQDVKFREIKDMKRICELWITSLNSHSTPRRPDTRCGGRLKIAKVWIKVCNLHFGELEKKQSRSSAVFFDK